MPPYREFAKLDGVTARLPDETTILRLRHLLERHNLAVDILRVVKNLLQHKRLTMRTGVAVDATLSSAPSSTKNADGERGPEMKPTRKGSNWYFGMKAHIGVGDDSGLVHTVACTPVNVNDLNMAGTLLHGEKEDAFSDAGYQSIYKRPAAAGPNWQVAMRRGKRKKPNPMVPHAAILDAVERLKVSIRANVEHRLRGHQAAVWVHQGSLPQAGHREISQGKRTVLEYLLSPGQKAVTEPGREW